MTSPEGLSYPKAKHRSERRWTRRSATVPQRQIYQLRKKGRRCKATNSRAMSSAAPWYRSGETSVESSILCSHGGSALVAKGAEKVENVETNFKYQDRAEGQRPRNFIRPLQQASIQFKRHEMFEILAHNKEGVFLYQEDPHESTMVNTTQSTPH
ncbi:hypothetical protein GW17_00037073 [Ensete ventricosum]|nr:hypothetical protein GW17_00037073 [Ensete ventricosum]